MNKNERVAHSQDYFGNYRNFWWNPDFVQLIATRLSWAAAKNVLEIGCGAGHWTRTIAPYLSPHTSITAIDQDPKWADPNADWAKDLMARSLELTISAGSANSLPFPDHTFDFVTCQTLLIHLPNPQQCISEMLRVLKPGGLLLCVEPDNFGTWTATNSLSRLFSIDDVVAEFKFQLVQERGREALGLGDSSCGALLPGLFSEFGLADIQVYLSDKTLPLFPPYNNPEQWAVLRDMEKWFKSAQDFSRDHAYKLYMAGGGNPLEFEDQWLQVLANREIYFDALCDRTYHSPGGVLMYLVSGRK
jgi:ubiquinone/menaquinone biosynthesis C-methylase UbiE